MIQETKAGLNAPVLAGWVGSEEIGVVPQIARIALVFAFVERLLPGWCDWSKLKLDGVANPVIVAASSVSRFCRFLPSLGRLRLIVSSACSVVNPAISSAVLASGLPLLPYICSLVSCDLSLRQSRALGVGKAVAVTCA